jgi:uncharacterized membrane protein
VSLFVVQAATALHLLAAAVFAGSNVFLDFVLGRHLALIPPGQATRLGERVGADFALLNWAALLALLASGAVLIAELGIDARLLEPGFYATGYGLAMTAMTALWVSVVASSALLTFYLRPRVLVKLPAGASVHSVAMAAWMRRLARFNGAASLLAIVAGGTLRWGGF